MSQQKEEEALALHQQGYALWKDLGTEVLFIFALHHAYSCGVVCRVGSTTFV
jgi:hypothetical protein